MEGKFPVRKFFDDHRNNKNVNKCSRKISPQLLKFNAAKYLGGRWKCKIQIRREICVNLRKIVTRYSTSPPTISPLSEPISELSNFNARIECFSKQMWTAFWDLQAVFSSKSGQHFETCKQFFQANLDNILRPASSFSSKSGQHFSGYLIWTAFFRLIWTTFWDLQAVFQANLDSILRLASSFSGKSRQHFETCN